MPHPLQAVIKEGILGLLSTCILGHKDVFHIPVDAGFFQTAVLGLGYAVGDDVHFIVAGQPFQYFQRPVDEDGGFVQLLPVQTFCRQTVPFHAQFFEKQREPAFQNMIPGDLAPLAGFPQTVVDPTVAGDLFRIRFHAVGPEHRLHTVVFCCGEIQQRLIHIPQ